MAGCLLGAALLSPAASGGGGKVPVWTKAFLAEPGHYVLTRDLVDVPPVLVIQSQDVTLDLNGHTVTATDTTNPAIFVFSPAGSSGSIEIRNGRVRGGSRGIWHSAATPVGKTRLRLEDLDVASANESGIVVQSASLVEILRCNIRDGAFFVAGIWVEALFQPKTTAVIEGTHVTNVGAGGIRLDGLGGGIVRDSVIHGWGTVTAAPAISVNGAGSNLGGVIVEGNTARGSDPDAEGIVVLAGAPRTALRKNVVAGTIASGLRLWSTGNDVSGNVVGVSGAASVGINVHGNDNRVEGNSVTGSAADGVVVYGGYALLEGNTVEGNTGWGISFVGPSNAFRDNVVRNNTAGAWRGAATDAGGNIP